MRITELIAKLEVFKSTYGDIEIAVDTDYTRQYADTTEVIKSVHSGKYLVLIKGHEL